jgi:hypothetical protein
LILGFFVRASKRDSSAGTSRGQRPVSTMSLPTHPTLSPATSSFAVRSAPQAARSGPAARGGFRQGCGHPLDCGFGDVSNFNRAFRTGFGESPPTFRRPIVSRRAWLEDRQRVEW